MAFGFFFKKSSKSEVILFELNGLAYVLSRHEFDDKDLDERREEAINSINNISLRFQRGMIDAKSDWEKEMLMAELQRVQKAMFPAGLYLTENEKSLLILNKPTRSSTLQPMPSGYINKARFSNLLSKTIKTAILASILAASVGALMGGIALLPVSMPLAICTIAVASLCILASAMKILSITPSLLFLGKNKAVSRASSFSKKTKDDYETVRTFINALDEAPRKAILNEKGKYCLQKRLEKKREVMSSLLPGF